jgi:hypothetical protein
MQTTLQHRPISEVKSDIHSQYNKLREACQKPNFNWNTVEPLFDKLLASIDNGLESLQTSG